MPSTARCVGLALPAVVRHGSAVPCANDNWFWASPSMYFQFKEVEGVAQLKSKLACGRAEPCLTTAGRAESNETGLLSQSRPTAWSLTRTLTIQLFIRHHAPPIVPFRLIQLPHNHTDILLRNQARMRLLILDWPRTSNDVIPCH